MLSEYELTHVDYSTVLTRIGEALDQIYLPEFVDSFESWLATQPPSSTDRYSCCFKNSEGNWRRNILKQNAYVERLAEHICKTTLRPNAPNLT